jgi:hypothetical protein
MTLPSQGKNLTQNEIFSIEKAVREAGIQQIHPEKMEAFANYLVQKIKQENK